MARTSTAVYTANTVRQEHDIGSEQSDDEDRAIKVVASIGIR